ncbi:MAG: hypothetical protein ACKESB_01925 [Candidatus Hodgkinia cicadicola]
MVIPLEICNSSANNRIAPNAYNVLTYLGTLKVTKWSLINLIILDAETAEQKSVLVIRGQS